MLAAEGRQIETVPPPADLLRWWSSLAPSPTAAADEDPASGTLRPRSVCGRVVAPAGRRQCWGCSRSDLRERKIFASARSTSGTSARRPRLVEEASGALDEAPAVLPRPRAAC
jgi:hypothetical protein